MIKNTDNRFEKLLIAPSILSADFSKMGDEVADICLNGADLIHCDVMDGVFVPNITFGIKMIKDIKKRATKPLDVHLMICEPQKYVKAFAEAGADYITVHYEACGEKTGEVLKQIRALGVKSGVAINPDTPLSAVSNCLPDCDMLLIMSVFPGFGGQSFIDSCYDKIAEARDAINRLALETIISVDGGVNAKNAGKVFACGTDVAVAGSAVFNFDDRAQAITALKNCK